MRKQTIMAAAVAALALAGPWWSMVQAASVKAVDAEFFEQKIRPVLVAECYECHSGEKNKGGLRLDYRGGWEKGGENGPAIIPGNASKSLLIQTIQHTNPDLKMPRNGAKLDDGIIQNFIVWVNRGAPDPRDEAPKADSATAVSWADVMAVRQQWWSFQPVKDPSVPKVKDGKWSKEPVDRFILAKLEEKGLSPAKPADKRTLIRRASFVLTGLPPKPEEVAAFLADNSPKAFESVVDRLLASPAFGEQWARHWMDLVRYAETHGSEGDPDIREAWRYRDYLIRALNADVPVNQLIKEHIAGDLLPQPRLNTAEGINESMLGIASLRFNEHGFQPVDTLAEQVKTVDNQIDVVTKAFEGLTVSCARCHDHKFDPVSQKDFYAMYGVFASSRPAQVMVDTPEVLNKNKAELTALKAQIKSALAERWLSAVKDELPAMLERNRNGWTDEQMEPLRDLEREVAGYEATARARVLQERGKKPSNLPQPLAQWSFEGDAKDLNGVLDGELRGGAVIKNGRLVLNGSDAFMESVPLKQDLREKTLEAWVYLGNLQQRAGGVVTAESIGGKIFDAIVFAEKESKQWVPGSNNFKRSQTLGGQPESAKPEEAVHVVLTYAPDGRVTFYRNGQPYGTAYSLASKQEELATFAAGQAHVLVGRRHTGGGSAFLTGEIEEARLYNHALSAEDVAASFNAGPGGVSKADLLAAMTLEEKAKYENLSKRLTVIKREAEVMAARKAGQKAAFEEAQRNEFNPLYAWMKFNGLKDAELTEKWTAWTQRQQTERVARQPDKANGYVTRWNLAAGGDAEWFADGQNISAQATKPGEFAIDPDGVEVVEGIYAPGVYSHLLTQKHGALYTSPRFKIETDNISVKALGGGGAMVRVIVDNYPLPMNPIYPKAILTKDEPGWVRIDTAYRKGSMAYLEFGTYDELTRPLAKNDTPREGRSWFGVEQVVFHDASTPPKDNVLPALALSEGTAPKDAAALLKQYQAVLTEAIRSWQSGAMTEPQRALLDYFVKQGLLPNDVERVGDRAKELVMAYRKLESGVPVARRAPGVIEGAGYDAPLMPRGDHLKPGEAVPRGFLQVLGKPKFGFANHEMAEAKSGRLQLAEVIVDSKNPLTARVMANRIWQHLFGRGIVGTVDNFGRLGDQPTHPELLDYLATQFVRDGWSTKKLVRTLLLSQTWQQSSEPSEKAAEVDGANDFLSHARVRRIEAENIRDALLAVAGKLDEKKFGPPVGNTTPRRSVYLAIRRYNLNPFLEVFDAPKPFTTLGRRDTTNVPAQSLALLNDPFVISLAKDWAQAMIVSGGNEEERIRRMFEMAFVRPPTTAEMKECQDYLAQLGAELKLNPKERLQSEAVWEDFAQSLFNLKEFIYMR